MHRIPRAPRPCCKSGCFNNIHRPIISWQGDRDDHFGRSPKHCHASANRQLTKSGAPPRNLHGFLNGAVHRMLQLHSWVDIHRQNSSWLPTMFWVHFFIAPLPIALQISVPFGLMVCCASRCRFCCRPYVVPPEFTHVQPIGDKPVPPTIFTDTSRHQIRQAPSPHPLECLHRIQPSTTTRAAAPSRWPWKA